jgi:predicted DNA binding protein
MTSERPCGLTDPQREALITAVENGYFDVPARATLESISEALGITSQAVSERLNRGTKTLVEATLMDRR